MSRYVRLLVENRRLRRRIALLERERTGSDDKRTQGRVESLLRTSKRLEKKYKRKSFFLYMISSFRYSATYRFYSMLRRIFKPTMLITRMFRWVMIVLTWIETSAFFLLFSTVFLIFLPIIGLLSVTTLAFSYFRQQRQMRQLRRQIVGKRLIVFLRNETITPFFCATVRLFASDYTILIVAESLHRLYGNDPALRAQVDTLSVCHVMRPYFFYALRGELLAQAKKVVLIY